MNWKKLLSIVAIIALVVAGAAGILYGAWLVGMWVFAYAGGSGALAVIAGIAGFIGALKILLGVTGLVLQLAGAGLWAYVEF